MADSRQKAALVVAADRRRAEFFIQEQRYSEPRPLLSLDAATVEGALPAEPTDQPGKAFDSHGQGRHKMEPQTTLRESAAIVFTQAIADRIDATVRNEGLEGLILIAEPRLLGFLRRAIESSTAAREERLEIDKDLVGREPEVLAAAISEAGGLARLG